MLNRIRIRNFKSLKDVTLHLQDVNLLIGPNNSGKTNLLKALGFLGDYYSDRLPHGDITAYTFQNKSIALNFPISFILEFLIEDNEGNKKYIYHSTEIYSLEKDQAFGSSMYLKKDNELLGISDSQLSLDFQLKNFFSFEENFSEYKLVCSNRFVKISIEELDKIDKNSKQRWDRRDILAEPGFALISSTNESMLFSRSQFPDIFKFNPFIPELSTDLGFLSPFISEFVAFSIEPSLIREPNRLSEYDLIINKNGSNLVSFLDNMNDSNPDIIANITQALKECIPEFNRGIRFRKADIPNYIYNGKEQVYHPITAKVIGLADNTNTTYWAEDLSDGVLYFLALLAIIYQPNPPRLLLLEEPEKGIHPRRIDEVVDYIFQLAQTKGIQVILTTHSTQVVSKFKDMTDGVFIFEKEGAETKVKNLQTDVIDPINKDLKKRKKDPIDFTEDLGVNWEMGLLGGVPNENH